MKPLAHDTLPLATTSALTPRFPLPQASDKATWSLALERAARQGASRAQAASRLATAQQLQAASNERAVPVSAAIQRAGFRVAVPLTSLALHPGEREQEPAAAVTARPASVEPAEEASEAPRAAPTLRTSGAAHERSPVRIHVEQHGEGLSVWIGCDAHVAPAQLASLFDALKTRPGIATPIAAIVCNGTPVYTRPTRIQENP